MKRLRVTVAGKTYDVTVEVLGEDALPPRLVPAQPAHEVAPTIPLPPAPVAVPFQAAPLTAAAGAVTSPMAGTVKSVMVKVGDVVAAGQQVVMLDAMKMEVPIAAPVGGKVVEVRVAEGQSVQEGVVLVVLE